MTSRKNDTKYHEKLKQASIYVYHEGNAQLPVGYRVIDKAENKENGFYAEAYSDGKDIIIAYRGTDDVQDISTDWSMIRDKYLNQAADAINFHDRVNRNNPYCDIAITGHSLGGTLAQVVTAIRGTLAVTFNAYGAKDLFKPGERLIENNSINYINEWDSVSMSNAENLIGDTYAIQGKFGHFAHFIEDFEPLSNREFRTPEDIKRHKNIFIRMKNKGHYNGHVIKTSIQQAINHAKKCVGSYRVSGYTREDGTKVDSYIRTCGAKHNN